MTKRSGILVSGVFRYTDNVPLGLRQQMMYILRRTIASVSAQAVVVTSAQLTLQTVWTVVQSAPVCIEPVFAKRAAPRLRGWLCSQSAAAAAFGL